MRVNPPYARDDAHVSKQRIFDALERIQGHDDWIAIYSLRPRAIQTPSALDPRSPARVRESYRRLIERRDDFRGREPIALEPLLVEVGAVNRRPPVNNETGLGKLLAHANAESIYQHPGHSPRG